MAERIATTAPKLLDPGHPQVRALIKMVNDRMRDGWAVIEDDLLMDARELRIPIRGPNDTERWIMLDARRLFRAKNPDTYVRYAVEQAIARYRIGK